MLRRMAILALLLFAPGWCSAQSEIVVGQRPTQEQVASAEQIIAASKIKPITLPIGGYALAKIDHPGKLKRYPWPGSDECLRYTFIPKGTTYEGNLVPADGTEYVDTVIPADPKFDRVLIRGVKPGGSASVAWIANGKTLDDEPVVVAGYSFIVGPKTPTPPPVPPKPIDPDKYTGLRVIIVHETEDRTTPEQNAILNSPKIREWLDKNCVKVEDGKPGWRKWDKNVILGTNVPKSMREMWDASKPNLGQLPQIVIVTDQKGESFALPETEQKTLDLLMKYGGK